MNRFIKRDGGFEKTIVQMVKNNFPAVDISTLMGFNIESFTKNGVMKTALSGTIDELSETSNNGNTRKMVWSTSRWGGSHSVI